MRWLSFYRSAPDHGQGSRYTQATFGYVVPAEAASAGQEGVVDVGARSEFGTLREAIAADALEQLVEQNRFREDLFHRLNVIRMHLPRLSERNEDIPMLMRHFFVKAAQELEVEPKVLSEEVSLFCQDLPWPGNVRQLENTCRWLTVMAAGREVLMSDLPSELISQETSASISDDRSWQKMLRRWGESQLNAGASKIMATALADFEKVMMDAALTHTGGRKKDAALLLGWGRNTLTRKLQEHGSDDYSHC